LNGITDDNVPSRVKSLTAGSDLQMRWDYANLELYRSVTGYHLQHIFQEMLTFDEVSVVWTDYYIDCI